jgi:hypothetical protein
MSPIRFSASSLKEGRWYEYLIRFALGGAATVFTGLISSRFGPSVGGLFLALPAIFCASATLIEKHEIRRKREAGIAGKRRGQEAAALDAAGAALGALGLLAFAIVFSLIVEGSLSAAFVGASGEGARKKKQRLGDFREAAAVKRMSGIKPRSKPSR